MEKRTPKEGLQSKMPYKYCFVPMCTNTSTKTPEKTFVSVPTDALLRRKWLLAARRDLKKNPLSSSTHLRCCEDHFNLEDDVENYTQWKIMGCNLRTRKGVLPHIFSCQDRLSIEPVRDRPTVQKRRRKEMVAAIEEMYNSQVSEDVPDSPPLDPCDWEEREEPPCHPPMVVLKVDRGIQVWSP
ncbi:uncharacterized protein LOC124171856 [Ischnura elegans]|uniref:uncharacterized protein LOC124171856 n=1 Tax=Ischnura elegans TaxID=197161 RepID=UPI001ED889A2|nr:uncharacterized protein LOC124171856 [Ischnura elegans]